MTKAFDMMMAGMDDAIAYAEGDHNRGRVATVDVKAVRSATRLSQVKFADAFRFRAATVRDWEQGRRTPDTGSLTLLKMIQADPEGVRQILAKVE